MWMHRIALLYRGHCMQLSGKSFHPNAGIGERSNVHFLLTFRRSAACSLKGIAMHGLHMKHVDGLTLITPRLLVFIRGEHVEEGPSKRYEMHSATRRQDWQMHRVCSFPRGPNSTFLMSMPLADLTFRSIRMRTPLCTPLCSTMLSVFVHMNVLVGHHRLKH